MTYLSYFMIFTLFITPLYADNFDTLNPPPTKQMKENQANALVCKNPAIAEDKFDANFRYGCFCGKGYPNLQHSSKKPYRYLDAKQKDELIAQYYSIKPYDSIDAACMQHDICYINKGREDQRCNDALYTALREIEDSFKNQENERKRDSLERRCKILASDISAVFRTIFGTGDNVSMIHFGMLAATTPLTLASKTLQKTSRGMHDGDEYPQKGEKCIVK